MCRASVRRTAAIVIILTLAATVGIAALVGGWSLELPGGATDEPPSAIEASPVSTPVRVRPVVEDTAENPAPSPAARSSATPAATPAVRPAGADLPAS